MNWSIICVTNNDTVLNSCLLKSPDAGKAAEILLQKGYRSAAKAYNDGIEKARADVLVLAHQDVYFPPGWLQALERAVLRLSKEDPNWAVLGVWGVNCQHVGLGNMYCAGLRERLGGDFEEPVEAQSLDEMVLIVRKSSGVRFDGQLQGFHMYGTDICLEAKKRGMKSYVISAFCVHNTNGYNLLPWDFWKAYFFMRRKWRGELPVTTSCIRITRGGFPMIEWNLRRLKGLMLKRHQPGKRVADPRSLLAQPAGGEAA